MRRWLVTAQPMTDGPWRLGEYDGLPEEWIVEVADESDSALAAVCTAARRATEAALMGMGDDRSSG